METLYQDMEENNKGLTYSARSKSQVTSPINGIIEFSGAFKNYNNIVIINAGEGYFVVFTGIGEIFKIPVKLLVSASL